MPDQRTKVTAQPPVQGREVECNTSQQTHLIGVAQIDRLGVVGVHQRHKAFNQVANILKGACLLAFTVNSYGLVLQRLDNKVANHATIPNMHARAKGVEDSGDAHLDTVLALVGIAHGLGNPLALVIACPWPNRIYISPVGFRLWMHLWVSVDLPAPQKTPWPCEKKNGRKKWGIEKRKKK